MSVVVYTQPNCVQCDATTRTMDKWGVEYKVVALQDFPHVLAFAQERGWTTAPIVMVHDVSGQMVDAWSGYKRNKIREVANGDR